MNQHRYQDRFELPEGRLAIDYETENGIVVYSLTAHALQAINRHQWIESEKRGYDCGNDTIEEWLQRYWKGWVRSKLLEHFLGKRFWGAFGSDTFNLFRHQSFNAIADEETSQIIADKLADGGENLDIINWAIQEKRDIDGVIALLERIDINAQRQRLLTNHIRLFL